MPSFEPSLRAELEHEQRDRLELPARRDSPRLEGEDGGRGVGGRNSLLDRWIDESSCVVARPHRDQPRNVDRVAPARTDREQALDRDRPIGASARTAT